jgi:hypothetical protein
LVVVVAVTAELAAVADFDATRTRALSFSALAPFVRAGALVRVGSAGATAFSRFSLAGRASLPAMRVRVAASDRADAARRVDGNAAEAADLLALVFMAILRCGYTRTLRVPPTYWLERRRAGYSV